MPDLHYLVELLGAGAAPMYFFAQVKATRRGRVGEESDLPVALTAEDVCRLAGCPVPSYLIGVDEPTGSAFVVAIDPVRSAGISSIPTSYPLNRDNLERLWTEVRERWDGLRAAHPQPSAFRF